MDDDMSHLFNVKNSLDTYCGVYSNLLLFVKLASRYEVSSTTIV